MRYDFFLNFLMDQEHMRSGAKTISPIMKAFTRHQSLLFQKLLIRFSAITGLSAEIFLFIKRLEHKLNVISKEERVKCIMCSRVQRQ